MEVVWGVIYLLGVGLTGTGYAIYYILRMAYLEMREDGRDDIGYQAGDSNSSSSE